MVWFMYGIFIYNHIYIYTMYGFIWFLVLVYENIHDWVILWRVKCWYINLPAPFCSHMENGDVNRIWDLLDPTIFQPSLGKVRWTHVVWFSWGKYTKNITFCHDLWSFWSCNEDEMDGKMLIQVIQMFHGSPLSYPHGWDIRSPMVFPSSFKDLNHDTLTNHGVSWLVSNWNYIFLYLYLYIYQSITSNWDLLEVAPPVTNYGPSESQESPMAHLYSRHLSYSETTGIVSIGLIWMRNILFLWGFLCTYHLKLV